jgi:hypothetical protein
MTVLSRGDAEILDATLKNREIFALKVEAIDKPPWECARQSPQVMAYRGRAYPDFLSHARNVSFIDRRFENDEQVKVDAAEFVRDVAFWAFQANGIMRRTVRPLD